MIIYVSFYIIFVFEPFGIISRVITILLNVRTLSVVEVFCHLEYCSKEVLREELEGSSSRRARRKFFEKSSKEVLREELDDLLPQIIEFWNKSKKHRL
jgi:hypothetical protein